MKIESYRVVLQRRMYRCNYFCYQTASLQNLHVPVKHARYRGFM